MTWPTFIPEGGLLDNRRLQKRDRLPSRDLLTATTDRICLF